MKKTITLLAILIATTLFAQNTYVPDDNFETYLETHNANGNAVTMGDATSMGNGVMDDYVPTAKISGVTTLNVQLKNIADLTGIEGFTALTTLTAWQNNLHSIDLSQNTLLYHLSCSSNDLTSLDVSNNTALTYLHCQYNQITHLDVSNNTSLTNFYCQGNALVNLNVKNGNNTNIVNSQFKAMSNPNLTCILVDDAAYSTTNWTNIDASASFNETACTQMTYVPDDNFETYLETHDANGNAVAMGDATSMGDGTINDIVLTDNISGVTNLNASNHNISDLTGIQDFSSLTLLYVIHSFLTSIDISNNIALTDLILDDNQIQSIDLSANINLQILYLNGNNLTDLDVSQNNQLQIIQFNSNQIGQIDLTNNPLLTHLYCNTNNLSQLDTHSNPNLLWLFATDNQLISLDVSQNSNLDRVFCQNNQLTTLNMQNGNNTNIYLFDATNNPNLTCILVDDASYSTTNWTNIDATSTFVNNQAACDALSVAENSFETQINLYPNPAKNSFTIQNNSNYTIENLSIYDMLGKLVLQTNNTNNTIDVSTLKNGIYLVKITSDGNKTAIQKIVINK